MKNASKNTGSRKSHHSTQQLRFCRKLLPALIASCFAYSSYAVTPLNPNNASFAPGTVTMQTLPGNVLQITNKNNAIINWTSFSLPTGHTAKFVQESATSKVLNRVTGKEASEIMGNILSGFGPNYTTGGTVYLINPNGIMFGGQSQVNVGGLVASTLGITDADFIAGRNIFNGTGAGPLIVEKNGKNQAQITALNPITETNPTGAGLIYLIAPNVNNQGVLTATNGQIVLAAGHSVEFVSSTDPNIRVVFSAAAGENAVNLGSIIAASGRIGIYGALLDLTGGIVQADKAVMGPNGSIILQASQSNLNLGSTVSVKGGSLILRSDTGNITQSASVDANELYAKAAGSVTLTNANNIANTIAGQAGTGSFQYSSVGNINVGTVNDLSGISAINGNVILTTSAGNITQTQTAPITAAGLAATASAGSVNLTNLNNNVNTLAGVGSESFQYASSGNIKVGTVNGVSGINSTGLVSLLSNDGNITTSGATISGASLVLTAATGIGSQATPLSTSVGSLTAFNNAGDAVVSNTGKPLTILGFIEGNNANAGGIYVISDSSITVAGAMLNEYTNETNRDGISLKAASGITLNDHLVALGASNALTTTTGNITQNDNGHFSLTNLIANASSGSVLLTNSNNLLNGTLNGIAGGDFLFNSAGGITVGPVPSVGQLGTTSYTAANNGITSTNGNIGLKANNGILINAPITATHHTVALRANLGSIVEQDGYITADAVSAHSTKGAVDLSNPQNNFNTFAGFGNKFDLINIGSLTIGNVGAVGTAFIPAKGGILAQAGNTAIVKLTSTTGSINTDPNTVRAPDADAAIDSDKSLILKAATGIGTQANPLSTSVNQLTATNDSGDIAISNKTGNTKFSLESITLNKSATGGGIYISGASTSFFGVLANGLEVNGPVVNHNEGAGSDIVLKAATGSLLINGSVTAHDTVALEANQSIVETAKGAINAPAVSAVAIGAGGDLGAMSGVNLSSGQNNIDVIAGSARNAFELTNNNTITVGSVGSVGTGSVAAAAVTGINVTNANGSINLTSTNGAINSAANAAVTGASLTLNASSGIGSQASPLLTSTKTLSVTNSAGGGDIAILNSNTPLTIASAIQMNGGGIFIDASNSPMTVAGLVKTLDGDIGLKTTGDLTLIGDIFGSGTVALKSFGGNIGQTVESGTITANKLSAVAAGDVTLGAENKVNTVAGSAGSSFVFNNNDSFQVGSVPLVGPGYSAGFFLPGVNGVTASGPISLSSTNGSILQGAGGLISTPNTLFLSAGGDIGASGTGVLLTSVGGLAVGGANNVYIYNNNPNNLQLYEVLASGAVNVTTAGSLFIPPNDNETNFTGSAINLVAGGDLTINPDNVISADGGNGPINLYAGFNQAPGSAPVSNGSTSTITTFLDNGALQGSPVTLYSNGFTDYVGNYTPIGNPEGAVYVYPAIKLSVGGSITVITKIYDGTTTAMLTGGMLQGVPEGINVTLNQTGVFATKNAGFDIPVTTAYSVSGAPFLFELAQPVGTFTGTIEQRSLQVIGQTASDKQYNANTTASITGGSLSGVIAGDNVIFSAATSGSFASKNVGIDIPVSVTSNMITGTDAANYRLIQPTGLAADITKAPLFITGLTVLNKIYDGNNTAQLSGATLSGVLGNDMVSLVGPTTGTFASSNVGTGIPVTLPQYSLGGNDAGNYMLTQPIGLFTANITAAGLGGGVPPVVGEPPVVVPPVKLPEPDFIGGLDEDSILKGDKDEIDTSISCS